METTAGVVPAGPCESGHFFLLQDPTMSQDQEYQHRVIDVSSAGTSSNSVPTTDSKEAGRIFRNWCKNRAANGGGEVTLQRRPIAPWETVESTKV